MKLVILAHPTGAPASWDWDWEAWVDGKEEDGSGLGATKWDAVRALIDDLEARDEA